MSEAFRAKRKRCRDSLSLFSTQERAQVAQLAGVESEAGIAVATRAASACAEDDAARLGEIVPRAASRDCSGPR